MWRGSRGPTCSAGSAQNEYTVRVFLPVFLLYFRSTITGHLATFPLTGHIEPEHGLYIYSVRRSPFVLLYDFDDAELRIHMVVHKGADRTTVDPSTVEW
jgi:hypothetical protein